MEQKVLRISTLVVIGAVVLRLVSAALPTNIAALQVSPELASLIVFLQTGRLVKPGSIAFDPPPETLPEETTPPETVPPLTQPPEISLPAFSAQDAQGIGINSSFSCSLDLPALLSQPLNWDLSTDAPTVLIVHSHASESYAPTGAYAEISPYHTLDKNHNMVSIGAYLTQLLEAGGITVLHDTALHDSPSYNAAYGNSRASVQDYLNKYPSIRLVLDLHRDSIQNAAGEQITQTVFSGDTTLAPLMFVVGTDAGGLNHPGWRENLALALKLQVLLEDSCSGLCRKINLRTERFNQDLSAGALLIEMGASGNSREQVLRSTKLLAESILALAHGSA